MTTIYLVYQMLYLVVFGCILLYLLAHFLEVGADFLYCEKEGDNCCHKHYVC